ncbi:hypothetical protein [Roseivirga spongicola]|uniref:hypothetical protein n=1 Tax=Roseivirga spongicola TaxID=333140 RepID=UPI002AC90818|nr:hypothetical protein [Roseivirga spongicola]WPZ08776.1 hypothetical protein T7867_10955 [Roseivirga spongicola]
MIVTPSCVIDGDLISSDKVCDYSFVASFAEKEGVVSCTIGSTSVNEDSTSNINIGNSGTTISPSYSVTSGDISNSTGGSVTLYIVAKLNSNNGTLIQEDSDTTETNSPISPSITLNNESLTGARIYVEVRLMDVPPES